MQPTWLVFRLWVSFLLPTYFQERSWLVIRQSWAGSLIDHSLLSYIQPIRLSDARVRRIGLFRKPKACRRMVSFSPHPSSCALASSSSTKPEVSKSFFFFRSYISIIVPSWTNIAKKEADWQFLRNLSIWPVVVEIKKKKKGGFGGDHLTYSSINSRKHNTTHQKRLGCNYNFCNHNSSSNSNSNTPLITSTIISCVSIFCYWFHPCCHRPLWSDQTTFIMFQWHYACQLIPTTTLPLSSTGETLI